MNIKQKAAHTCLSAALVCSLVGGTLYSGHMALEALNAAQETDMEAEQAEMQRQLQEESYHIDPMLYYMVHGRISSVSTSSVYSKLTQQQIVASIAQFENIHYVGECTLTAYCCEPYKHICGTGTGLTATGLVVQPGFVAVDPNVIPLGSTVIIGENVYLAADTGGAIKGNRIDIAMETHQEALDYGKHIANVWYIAPEKE